MAGKRPASPLTDRASKRQVRLWGFTLPLQLPTFWGRHEAASSEPPAMKPTKRESLHEGAAPILQDSTDGQVAHEPENQANTSSIPIQLNQHSSVIHAEFRRRYSIAMSYPQFIGACAYLCALLLLGYQLGHEEMDDFVCAYDRFALQLPALEMEQTELESPYLVSYHSWFQANKAEPKPGAQILTEEGLRRIWTQHPHSFLDAEIRLDLIARKRLYASTRRTS